MYHPELELITSRQKLRYKINVPPNELRDQMRKAEEEGRNGCVCAVKVSSSAQVERSFGVEEQRRLGGLVLSGMSISYFVEQGFLREKDAGLTYLIGFRLW
jgi:hypothetical protein